MGVFCLGRSELILQQLQQIDGLDTIDKLYRFSGRYARYIASGAENGYNSDIFKRYRYLPAIVSPRERKAGTP
jgi:hypothetical protein